LHIELIEAKVFRTFIRIYSLFKSEQFSVNIKLPLQKALIWGIMTYACLPGEFAADNHPLKLQLLQNEVLCTTGNFPKCTLIHNLHMAFKLPYIYDSNVARCKVYILTRDLLLLTDSGKRQTCPLLRTPHINKPATV
jgi:hypothetical protein